MLTTVCGTQTMKMKILFPLLLLCCQAVWSIRPPQIDGEEMQTVKEMDKLVLRCRGSKPLHWHVPHVESHILDVTADTEQEDANFPYVSILEVEDVLGPDTGYYYCRYNDSTSFSNDKEREDSVYVFVYGKNVFIHNFLDPIFKQVGETLQIDCIVTSPNYTVTLEVNDRDITKEDRVKYDPRMGFSVENVTMEDDGRFTCESEGQKLVQTVNITIATKERLKPPSINIGMNQHFVKGEKFSLRCTVLDHDDVQFTWKYPNKRVKHSSSNESERKNNTTYYYNILKVSEASENDTGRYTCNISSEHFLSNSAFIDIIVVERKDTFVEIESNPRIKVHEGAKDEVKWKTTVKSYPMRPDIRYTNWRGQVVNETERINIEYDEPEGLSWLKIKNITSSDFGNYSITVTVTDKGIEKSASATVKFEVSSAPHMKIKGVGDLEYVSKGQELNVTCQATGFPDVSVSLRFQNCPSTKTSCGSPTVIEAGEIKGSGPGNIFEKSTVFSPNTSGYLQCHGENEHGSHSDTLLIKMSDIDGIFVMRYYGPDESIEVNDQEKSITVVENSDFTLMCGGAKFDYRMVEVNSSHQTGSNIQFQSSESEFSWQKKKEVRKATMSLTGHYNCYAYPHEDKDPEVKSLNITIVPEEEVVFEKGTNMKGQTEVVKDDGSFTLKCLVRGSPQPSIQWQKDNKNLTKESGLFDEKAMSFSSNQMELEFRHVGKKHRGLYTCIAKNRINKVTGSLILEKASPGLGRTALLILAVLFVGIAVSVIVIVFLIHRVKKEQEISKPFRMHAKEFFENGNIESLNLASTADKQAEMLPYNKKKWEVPRANITFGRQLGSGAFGRVIKATVTGLQGPATTTVAIKTCKNDVNAAQIDAIISELKIMMHLGVHLNIVNLLGANTEQFSIGEIWILVEYCRFGNLLEFMQKRRKNFTNLISPVTGKIDLNLVPSSPTSPTFRCESVSSSHGVDQDEYLAPIAKQFALSDPPEGHSGETFPSSTTVTSPSSSSTPQVVAGQFASNPLYSMNIKPATENAMRESRGSEDLQSSKFPQRKRSRLHSIGSITLSDGTSFSHLLRNRRPSQQSCQAPLSPTETYLIGENDPDIFYEIGSVPGITAPFSTIDLISWGWQMAQGMNYLSRRKILHGDLAARNLLLADNNVLKISDFGLSRNMYRNDNYVKKGDDLLPIKWMSIEAIRDKIFSIESDVWAFGITLWEIFSLGCSPYAGVEVSNDFLEKLENGHRMSCPKYGNEEIYDIMKQCWEEDPLKRPSFNELVNDLGNMISDHTEKYLSLNETYMQMNSERFKEETDYLSMMAKPTFESRTSPDEIDIEHDHMRDSTKKSSIRTEFPDTSVYINARSVEASFTASPIETSYLPMSAAKPQSPSDDVFRFSFLSSNPEGPGLASLPEEERSTSLEPEEPLENSVLLSTSKKLPSDENLSDE